MINVGVHIGGFTSMAIAVEAAVPYMRARRWPTGPLPEVLYSE